MNIHQCEHSNRAFVESLFIDGLNSKKVVCKPPKKFLQLLECKQFSNAVKATK